jgi:hypothetical protein
MRPNGLFLAACRCVRAVREAIASFAEHSRRLASDRGLEDSPWARALRLSERRSSQLRMAGMIVEFDHSRTRFVTIAGGPKAVNSSALHQAIGALG